MKFFIWDLYQIDKAFGEILPSRRKEARNGPIVSPGAGTINFINLISAINSLIS